VFSTIDADNSGAISAEELKAALPAATGDQAAELFRSLDKNKDGRIELAEFMAHASSWVGSSDWASVSKWMDEVMVACTMNASSKRAAEDQGIDAEALIAEMRPVWTSKGQRLFAKIDKDGDGSLTLQELQLWASQNQEMAKGLFPSTSGELDDLFWAKFLGMISDAGTVGKLYDVNMDGQLSEEEFVAKYVDNMGASAKRA